MMILRHYNAIPNSETIDHSRVCNYLGHLKGDEVESSVAITGCLMGDDTDEKIHITILSKHTPFHKTFSLDANGNVKHIETRSDNNVMEQELSPKVTLRETSPWKACGSDAFYNELQEFAAFAVTAEQTTIVPSTLTLKFRIGYDKGVKSYLRRRGKNVDNWLAEVMTHAQAHYTHSSLQNKIIFQVIVCPSLRHVNMN
jgi:hypothetical protein